VKGLIHVVLFAIAVYRCLSQLYTNVDLGQSMLGSRIYSVRGQCQYSWLTHIRVVGYANTLSIHDMDTLLSAELGNDLIHNLVESRNSADVPIDKLGCALVECPDETVWFFSVVPICVSGRTQNNLQRGLFC
jgi:hypothetical protein